MFDYDEISSKKAKLISNLVLLSNNTQLLSIKIYTYVFITIFIAFQELIEKSRMFQIFSLLWFLSCIAYNLMDIKIELIMEGIEDYASTEPDEDIEPIHYFMEIENTEIKLSIIMNVIMSILHFYFLFNMNLKNCSIVLIIRLLFKEIIKAIELKYK